MVPQKAQKTYSNDIWVDPDTKEVVDISTGVVLGYETSMDAEWRAFTLEEKGRRSRVGPPSTPVIYDEGTMMGNEDMDASGKKIDQGQLNQIYRMRKWNRRAKVHGNKKRNLSIAIPEIERVVGNIDGLPRQVSHNASKLYRRAMDEGYCKGRTITDMAAAAVFTACRELDIQRFDILEKISELSGTSKGLLKNYYRLFLRNGEKQVKYIDSDEDKKQWKRMPIQDPRRYVSQLREQVPVSKSVEDLSLEILEKADKEGLLQGKSPKGNAATAFYKALKLTKTKKSLDGNRISQRIIADVVGITDVTIRNRCKDFEELDISYQR
ncbi:MAG: hypothetical protein V1818_01610 [Candidatus Aenigmatarchaeota archaeon]